MKKTLVPVILLIVSAGLFFWQINPLYTAISALRAQSQQYDDALAVRDQLTQLQNTLAQKFDSFPKDQVARLETFLPDHFDSVRLILDVSGIAGNFGITLGNIQTSNLAQATPGTTVTTNPYNTSSISFSFTAPYATTVSFIKGLESSLRLVDVESIDIAPTKDKKLSGYDVTMTLNTYWL